MSGLLIADVELATGRADVRCSDGLITDVGSGLVPRPTETVIRGVAAAIPGLHDHHLHLQAMAARSASVDVSSGAVSSAEDLRRVLQQADGRMQPGAWVRAVGYDERSGGWLDRSVLDAAVPRRPVRVQHRSGHLWVLNSAACAALEVDRDGSHGVEREDHGVPTGRLFDRDEWLRARTPRAGRTDLGSVSRRLASYGVTGVTDATPTGCLADLEPLATACRDGTVVQRVQVMGGVELAGARAPEGLSFGPSKVVVADSRYPTVGALGEAFEAAHRHGRPVAVHCVTRIAAVLAIAAWDQVGARAGDRMEHGGVLPPDLVARLAELRITVVTQPSFLEERGDEYLAEVETDDLPHLYRCATLQQAGVGLGGSTDAPFGPEDPWKAMASAVGRRTRSGRHIGAIERLTPTRALELFLSGTGSPGGPPRTVLPGARADLCLLDCSRRRALEDLDAGHVVATVVGGRIVHWA